METLRHTFAKPGISRGLSGLLKTNRPDGFDCPGCAWPESQGNRKRIEFCENGAKAVADETTRRIADRNFFARYSLEDLGCRSGRWLNEQGRLSVPMVRHAGATHYEPISWSEAYLLIATELRALASPDDAVFYTSGRTSNEAAFLYQLFVRRFGTNNLPDSSNLCHESSSVALTDVLGSGKGSVSLEDFDDADAILVFGQNPGSNHPRMLATLQKAKRRGAKIVAINPLDETGLKRFRNPQELSGYVTRGTRLANLHVPVRINGDVPFIKGVCKAMIDAEDAAPGRVLDHQFINSRTIGFDAFIADIRQTDWVSITVGSGVDEDVIREAARIVADAGNVICCWAMGMTQHRNAVANIRQMVNLLLLGGHIGRPGAGVCPVRGHSNVQGDRTMGITERPKADFIAALGAEFGFSAPTTAGLNAIESINAMHVRQARVFIGLGGNFAAATPDPAYTETALQRCRLTVQVSTKLNRSHVVCGEQALILPTLGRSDNDLQPAGRQFVTCENSMGVVSMSSGGLSPISECLRSEVRIVAEIAHAFFGGAEDDDWQAMADDYDRIRDRIERVVPGFDAFNARIRRDGHIVLPHAIRDERRFETPSGKAVFSVDPIEATGLAGDELMMMTIRSHDQFNTTVYTDNDRYRGIRNNRHVVFMHPQDASEAGLEDGRLVDIVSEFAGIERSVCGFRVVTYPIPRGCVATYYPEANGLVPIDHVAAGSNTPAYKSVPVRVQAAN